MELTAVPTPVILGAFLQSEVLVNDVPKVSMYLQIEEDVSSKFHAVADSTEILVVFALLVSHTLLSLLMEDHVFQSFAGQIKGRRLLVYALLVLLVKEYPQMVCNV